MPVTHLLYLHGFRSSPQSTKARRLGQLVREHAPEVQWWCPQLPPSPRESLALLLDGIRSWPHRQMAVVGSSLGGFYATCIAETTGCAAVLLNPAVDPARDLSRHIGEHVAWHDPSQRFHFAPHFVDELRAMTPATITRPERYFAVIAKGDEVLDWREMTGRYPGAHIELLEGSDHALTDFEPHALAILKFLGMR